MEFSVDVSQLAERDLLKLNEYKDNSELEVGKSLNSSSY